MMEKWKTSKHGMIYGCGPRAIEFWMLAEESGCAVDCMVISDGRKIPEDIDIDVPIKHLSNIEYSPDECFVVVTVAEESKNSVMNVLKQKGYRNVY